MKKVLLGIFICLCSIILMSHNTSAVEISQQVEFLSGYHYPYWSDNHNRTYATGGYSYSTNGDYSDANILYFRNSSNGSLSATAGRFVSLTGTITMTVTSNSQIVSIQANPRQYFAISSSNVSCPLIDITDTDYQQYQSGNNTWRLRYNFVTVCRLKQNITSNVAINLYLNGGSTSGTDTLSFNPQYLAFWGAVDGYDDTNVINAIGRITTAINALGDDLDVLGDKMDDVIDSITEQNDKEQQATDNISDQTPSDISSDGQTENAQTTSLINVFGSFLSAISGVNTGSCNVQLPFPSYAGGTWNMNICQNKDKAGNIVSLFGSATLVFFFLPVAWRLLGMIYNEIRSFTNG